MLPAGTYHLITDGADKRLNDEAFEKHPGIVVHEIQQIVYEHARIADNLDKPLKAYLQGIARVR